MLSNQKRGDEKTLRVNPFIWVLKNCFRKLQDRLGTEKKAASLHELVDSAQNITVLNERIFTGDQERTNEKEPTPALWVNNTPRSYQEWILTLDGFLTTFRTF